MPRTFITRGGFTDSAWSFVPSSPAATRTNRSRLGFVDRELKNVHAGYLCYGTPSQSSGTLIDHKTGAMNLEIRKRRQSYLDRKEPLPADLDAVLKTTQITGPWKADNEWHELVFFAEGDEMRLSINGELFHFHPFSS